MARECSYVARERSSSTAISTSSRTGRFAFLVPGFVFTTPAPIVPAEVARIFIGGLGFSGSFGAAATAGGAGVGFATGGSPPGAGGPIGVVVGCVRGCGCGCGAAATKPGTGLASAKYTFN